jgi:diphosphomevalonate decarboxylase
MSRSLPHGAIAKAHANIAIAKYWGKADVGNNLPAVPSVSVTLSALTTTTTVRFVQGVDRDELELNGAPAGADAMRRAVCMLNQVRELAGISHKAQIQSSNDFPTASGLASSASAFAALALASMAAAGLPEDRTLASDMARRASASAARSVWGGFVCLPAGTEGMASLPARQIATADHWDLSVVVAVTTEAKKAIGSTEGMQHTAKTSPYYCAWIELCTKLATRVQRAIQERDLRDLGEAAEQSALAMHACAMSADPAILYFEPSTIACLKAVRALRASGVQAYATIDAGPHVKVLTVRSQKEAVSAHMARVPGVLRTIESDVGGDAGIEMIEGA